MSIASVISYLDKSFGLPDVIFNGLTTETNNNISNYDFASGQPAPIVLEPYSNYLVYGSIKFSSTEPTYNISFDTPDNLYLNIQMSNDSGLQFDDTYYRLPYYGTMSVVNNTIPFYFTLKVNNLNTVQYLEINGGAVTPQAPITTEKFTYGGDKILFYKLPY